MFFEEGKRQALRYGAFALAAGAIPGVNFMVAQAVASLPSRQMDDFESNLQETVCWSTKYWLPALCLLPIALTFLLLNVLYDLVKLGIEAVSLSAAAAP